MRCCRCRVTMSRHAPAGLCNTHFWVDRMTGICASIYSNFLPFVPPEGVALYNDFERALYASL
jgi:methyl acetate hydrolase